MGVHPSMSIVGTVRREREISRDCPGANLVPRGGPGLWGSGIRPKVYPLWSNRLKELAKPGITAAVLASSLPAQSARSQKRGQVLEYVDQPFGCLQRGQALGDGHLAEGLIEQRRHAPVGGMGARPLVQSRQSLHDDRAAALGLVIALLEGRFLPGLRAAVGRQSSQFSNHDRSAPFAGQMDAPRSGKAWARIYASDAPFLVWRFRSPQHSRGK